MQPISFGELLNFNTEKFSTVQRGNKVDVIYKPTDKVIGKLTVTNSGEVVIFDQEGSDISTSPKNIPNACYFLLNRSMIRRR